MFIRLWLYLQETKKDMETIQIKLEKQLLDKALVYAKQRGVDLSAMLSDYLSRLVKQEEKKQEIPDVVQSLLGAGTPVAPDDLNGRKAYQQFLEEKYR